MQFITTDNRIAVENFQIGYFYTITFNNHNYIITTCTGKGDNFVSFLCSEPELVFDLTMQTADSIATIELYGGGTGTTDYNNLSNKPSINNVLLVGNKTTSDLLINDVPAVTSADDSKILMSTYSGGVGSYSWETYSPISSYDDLNDKPTINSITLSGNKTSSDLGLQSEINSENLLLSDNVDDTNQTHKFATAAQLEQIATNETNISLINSKLIYSPTQPTGDITDGAIWINTAINALSDYIKKYHVSKQLFDKNNVTITSGYIAQSNGEWVESATTKTAFMACEPNKTYTVSKLLSARFAVGCFNTMPNYGDRAIVYESNTEATSLTITTSSDATIIGIFFYYANADTKTQQEILDSIMVNTGETALPYEPYTTTVWHSNNT